ncbi:Atu4866 domain-containing protein [Actinomadura alba]|uniref:Atu4866 domain-containing protein n=1 Tax=Actinomadura alba TaxID=406431 RepID=A0ABR7LS52_9ACTN|nr:Atu4866 domain-containing protein [Actinomadura alba]MBC6467580.1 Atu4866 domain-containing protein [Actinomadura alba]
MRTMEFLTVIKNATGANARPLLLAGGTVVSMSPLLGDWEKADVLIGGEAIVGIGPGLLSAAQDDGMIIIDCADCLVLPSRTDFTGTGSTGTLAPGNRADIAVIRIADPDSTPDGPIIARDRHLDILLDGGQVTLWNGHPADPAQGTGDVVPPAATTDHPYVGLWVDQDDFLRQGLLPDGRYDEARGDRPSAYTGRYWIDGTRIDYLDDLGFWAYGEFHDGELHHAGYRLTRR